MNEMILDKLIMLMTQHGAALEKLELVTSAHGEQIRKDHEENRRLWREQQTEFAAIWRRMEERDKYYQSLNDHRATEQAERDTKQAARDAVTDKRIADLVSAIGELIRQMKRNANGNYDY